MKAFEDPASLELRAVFLDISKAFDKVWHDGLIFKLRQNGVNGGLLKLFESYLHNREQRVVINGSYSEYLPIEAGVRKGSVFGPLVFLIYINDLEKNIKSNIKFFADDTMLFSIVKDPAVSARKVLNARPQPDVASAYIFKSTYVRHGLRKAVDIFRLFDV